MLVSQTVLRLIRVMLDAFVSHRAYLTGSVDPREGPVPSPNSPDRASPSLSFRSEPAVRSFLSLARPSAAALKPGDPENEKSSRGRRACRVPASS